METALHGIASSALIKRLLKMTSKAVFVFEWCLFDLRLDLFDHWKGKAAAYPALLREHNRVSANPLQH
ncbi:hypothetical protein CDAR_114621 [Caerostris darwini]|uniref:Uncharacterized protein n=1 Tax=Caerostris darwini TaxID=1538125 RepID=A0AAV4R2X1_9ARAC|nr:hypothetical protein CDAR_114621 [Caerostris darwini]